MLVLCVYSSRCLRWHFLVILTCLIKEINSALYLLLRIAFNVKDTNDNFIFNIRSLNKRGSRKFRQGGGGGGGFKFFFVVREARLQRLPKTGELSACQRNAIEIALRQRADNGPPLNLTWQLCNCQGIRTSITRNPIIL